MRRTLLAAAVAALAVCATADINAKCRKNGTGKLPEIADMTLCYGGSSHRTPFKWDEERFAPHVTYVAPDGSESWLFESFLAIEFVDKAGNMTYQAEQYHKAADKNSWTQLLDYWFEDGYGFDALDKAVADASARIGAPKRKRMVIMTIPDPIIHKTFSKTEQGSVYWGEVDGKALDFSNPADRRLALKWYVDETIRRFAQKKYRNIEFIGFYIISEDLATTDNGDDGWSAEFKRYDQIYPANADYIHSKGLGLYWIPYFDAGGYSHWKEYGIDLCIMQPNYFWKGQEGRMERFVKMISDYGMGMELELDDELLGDGEDADRYRENMRTYLRTARETGIYGTKPFAMYAGQDTFHRLAVSDCAADRQMYREICEFLLANPLKKY